MVEYRTRAGGFYGRLRKTMRTTIPSAIVAGLGIEIGDFIQWSVLGHGVVVVSVVKVPLKPPLKRGGRRALARSAASRPVRQVSRNRPQARDEGIEGIPPIDEGPDPFGTKPIRNPDGSIMNDEQYAAYDKRVQEQMNKEDEEEEDEDLEHDEDED